MLTLDEIKDLFYTNLKPLGFNMYYYDNPRPEHQYVTISYPLEDENKYESYNEWSYLINYSHNGIHSMCKFANDTFPTVKILIANIVEEAAYLRDLERNHRCY